VQVISTVTGSWKVPAAGLMMGGAIFVGAGSKDSFLQALEGMKA